MNETVKIPGTNIQVVPKAPMKAGGEVTAFVPQSLDEVWRFAEIVSAGGFAPPGLKSPQAVMVAIMHGAEVGLTPFASIKNIAVINNRPTIWGDGCVGIVRASGLCEYIKETVSGQENDWVATCTIKRKNEPEETRTFSVADAKRAGVWGKAGPWSQYPKRMLGIRARSFALRDVFPDVLGGLDIREEVEDSVDMIDVTPPPAPPAAEGESSAEAAPAIQRKPRAKRTASSAPAGDVIEDEVATDVPEEEDAEELFAEYEKHLMAGKSVEDIGATWDIFEGRIKAQGPHFTQQCSAAYVKRKEEIQGETTEERKARLRPAYDDGIASFYRGRKRTLGAPAAYKDGGELEKTWWKGYENADQGREPNPLAPAQDTPPPADDTPPPASTSEPVDGQAAIDAAYEAGRQAHAKGVSKRGVPDEYRAPERQAEAAAWLDGWNDAHAEG